MFKLITPDFMNEAKNSPPLLEIKNLSCAYTHRKYGLFGKKEIKPVLDNINMEIKPGEIFGLTGESGCGKSTLARCILGLIPCTGEIIFNGEKLEKIRGHELRLTRSRLSQMVFQESGASLNPVKNIGWLLEEPLIIHKLYNKEESKTKTDEILYHVGLDPSYKKRLPHELSGGQKQRVCIGRSLLLSPKLLIADEAVNSLDVSESARILNLFTELNKNYGLSILFISHNKNAVEYLCDRIAEFS